MLVLKYSSSKHQRGLIHQMHFPRPVKLEAIQKYPELIHRVKKAWQAHNRDEMGYFSLASNYFSTTLCWGHFQMNHLR